MASYVYRQLNKVTGEYYIGKGTYSSKDPDGSRYLGSGILFLRKYRAHPQDFEKEILKDFEDESEAYAYERELIGEKYIGGAEHDLLCLNMDAGGRGVSSSFMRAFYKNPSNIERSRQIGKSLWADNKYRAKVLLSRQGSVAVKRIEAYKIKLRDPIFMEWLRGRFRCASRRENLRRSNMVKPIRIEKNGVVLSINRDELSDYFRLGWSLCSKGVVNIYRSDIGVYSCGQHDVVKHLVVEHGFQFGTHYGLERVNYDVISNLEGVKQVKSEGQVKSWSDKPVLLVSPSGDVVSVARGEYLDKLRLGYEFKSASVDLRNNTTKQVVFLGRGSAKKLLLRSSDWELGSRRGYVRIGAKGL